MQSVIIRVYELARYRDVRAVLLDTDRPSHYRYGRRGMKARNLKYATWYWQDWVQSPIHSIHLPIPKPKIIWTTEPLTIYWTIGPPPRGAITRLIPDRLIYPRPTTSPTQGTTGSPRTNAGVPRPPRAAGCAPTGMLMPEAWLLGRPSRYTVGRELTGRLGRWVRRPRLRGVRRRITRMLTAQYHRPGTPRSAGRLDGVEPCRCVATMARVGGGGKVGTETPVICHPVTASQQARIPETSGMKSRRWV